MITKKLFLKSLIWQVIGDFMDIAFELLLVR